MESTLQTLWEAGQLMAGLGICFGTVLAVAYRFLRVEEDPRIETVETMLPGNNCGACGQPGCHAFAEKLIEGAAQPANCTVSDPEGLTSIATFLGVEAGQVDKRIARLHCAGGKGFVGELARYRGITSCRGAVLVNGGGRTCVYGCLGLADCAHACDFSAIQMNAQGLPTVNPDTCTACGDCVEVCPLDLFHLEPLAQKLVVQCSSPLTGERATQGCAVACDGCSRCVADAGDGVLSMVNGLPQIQIAEATSPEATLRCPTGAIQWVEHQQFATLRPEGYAHDIN